VGARTHLRWPAELNRDRAGAETIFRDSPEGSVCLKYENELGVAARGHVLYGGLTSDANPIRPEHHQGMQRNLHRHLNVNPSVGDVDAPSRHASDLSRFVNPGQRDRFVRRVPIAILEISSRTVPFHPEPRPGIAGVT